MVKTKKKHDITNTFFLIIGLSLTFVLYLSKTHEEKREANITQTNLELRENSNSFPSSSIKEFHLPSYSYIITKHCISNQDFHIFVQSTRYRTWRECHNYWPNWRYPFANEATENSLPSFKTQSSDPAIYLTREDAEAYCAWLQREQPFCFPYGKVTFQLPSTEELETAFKEDSFHQIQKKPLWEWTRDDLSHFNQTMQGANNYLTAWKSKQSLRHRRIQEMGHRDTEPTGFRVSWISRTTS